MCVIFLDRGSGTLSTPRSARRLKRENIIRGVLPRTPFSRRSARP